MSRTHHRRPPRDVLEAVAPRPPDKRKRALYSFKRIHGVVSACGSDDEGAIIGSDPAIAG